MSNPLCIVANFEEAVQTSQDEVALIIEDGRSYTYSELDDLSTSISRHVAAMIDQLDIDMGDNDTPLVSVMMPRDVGIIVSILGILKAGAAYVPVDPAFPPHRQSYIFGHSRCHLLVADSECHQKALALGVSLPPTLIIGATTGEIDGGGAENPSSNEELELKRADQLVRLHGGLAYVL